MFLKNKDDVVVAGWSFSKLLEHWKRKHSKTCFVSYKKQGKEEVSYRFGPEVIFAVGADFNTFFNSIANGIIYYDPGVKMDLQENGTWKPKKRNQFRVKWKNISDIYESTTSINLNEL